MACFVSCLLACRSRRCPACLFDCQNLRTDNSWRMPMLVACMFLDNSNQRIFVQLVQNNRMISDKSLLYDNYSSVVARNCWCAFAPSTLREGSDFQIIRFLGPSWPHPSNYRRHRALTQNLALAESSDGGPLHPEPTNQPSKQPTNHPTNHTTSQP